MAFHMSETTEKYKHHYLKKTRYKPMSCRKMGARLNFIEHILHLFTYCISARIFFVSGIILSSKQLVISKLFHIKKWSISFKSTYHAEKECTASFHTLQFSFKNIVYLFKGIYVLYSRQAATWKQYVPSKVIEFDQGLLQCASTIAPFDSNTECLT